MNKELIYSKLDSLRRCIKRIEEKRPESIEKLSKDMDAQDIIVLNLERAVQQCVDIAAHLVVNSGLRAPSSMSEGFSALANAGILSEDSALRMRRAVGFRNVAVHEYREMNIAILYTIVTTHLNDFRDFSHAVVAELDKI